MNQRQSSGPDVLGSLLSGVDPTHLASPEPTQITEQCSRKSCTHRATWQLLWNNPRIHDPQRRKIWLACPHHRQYLEEFLAQRSFLKEVKPFPEPTSLSQTETI